MNILITGGAGFIGSHLCDALVIENNLTVLDNLSLGTIENIDHLKEKENFNFIEGDILNKLLLNKVFSDGNFDIVFHMAANSDIAQSYENPSIDKDSTFMTTYMVLHAMKEQSVKKIVFASTSAVYGDTPDELTESYGPLLPVSHYGASKLASEAFISSFSENYGIQAWIVRFPNVVGERATHGAIFDFINKLNKNPKELEVLGDGSQNKPYLYVKDLVEAILYVWKNSNTQINLYNIGVTTRTTVADIATMVIAEMGLDATIKYTGGNRGWIGDVPEFNYNLDKIHKLGWKAQKTSDESIRLAIQSILKT